MTDFFEIDFLGVETDKSGDAIAIRYSRNGATTIHVVDGGYLDTGDQLVDHIYAQYNHATHVDHVVLTHPDQDHANGLRKVLERCTVGRLWMNRPWLYAADLLHRFSRFQSAESLAKRLREAYPASVKLEELAIAKGIPISEAFQGAQIGAFVVLTPSKARFLDLIAESQKTPDVVSSESATLDSIVEAVAKALKSAANFVRSKWGEEIFPADGTSSENEMSVVQIATVASFTTLLTGDTGRDGLTEAADFLIARGISLPLKFEVFQVPHHGGRHNVNTAVLDRWLGARLPSKPEKGTWNAVCSSALKDKDHPRKSVKRAMIHRGANFTETEGKAVRFGTFVRPGWTALSPSAYPEDQEE
ncbi:MAG: MBL fold metallo-hydrolase [Nevskiaceae bacterium]|nr:MAG: MBL fold metallo-hydrolase [Nevskiaceae bacterium]TAM21062.1 MAG: MBL fold metallo-hydrolase [Nevskiaceae bacterium]